jgi:hypothetical protein
VKGKQNTKEKEKNSAGLAQPLFGPLSPSSAQPNTFMRPAPTSGPVSSAAPPRALPLRQTLAASRLPCTSARWTHGLSLTPAACQPRSCALESLGVGRMDGVAGRRAQRPRQAPKIARAPRPPPLLRPHGPPCPHYQARVDSASPHTLPTPSLSPTDSPQRPLELGPSSSHWARLYAA